MNNDYETVVFEANGKQFVHYLGRYVEQPLGLVRELRPQ